MRELATGQFVTDNLPEGQSAVDQRRKKVTGGITDIYFNLLTPAIPSLKKIAPWVDIHHTFSQSRHITDDYT